MVYSFKGVDMSQGGQGMFATEPAVTVIGSDGKMYGSHAAARAAGVLPEPETYNQPVPMPGISAGGKGGGDPYSQRPMPPDFMPMPGNDLTPMPGISAGGKGGGDPYSQIIGQMGYGSDPYSQIMSQTPDFQDPYARSSYGPSGGYDPRIYNNAFAGSNSRLNLDSGFGGGGGGGDATTNPFSDLTDAQRAGYYAQNPTMGAITRAGQNAIAYTKLGALQNLLYPSFVAQKNVETYGYAPENYFDPGLAVAADAAAVAQENNNVAAGLAAAQDAQDAAQGSISDQNTSGDGGGYGGYSDGGGSGSFGEGQYNMGGPVDRVGGPNPPGPDDGAGMLQLGEYVIKKSAVKKYGQGLLDMINNGKIPAKKIKSLLG